MSETALIEFQLRLGEILFLMLSIVQGVHMFMFRGPFSLTLCPFKRDSKFDMGLHIAIRKPYPLPPSGNNLCPTPATSKNLSPSRT
jgi:hypothetical protein